MSDIVITEFMDAAAVDRLASRFAVTADPTLVDDPARLLALLPACRGLIVRNRTQVRGDLLAAARSLRVVGRLGVGLDNIDLDACRARNIAVRPATGANTVAVAEYVFGALLTLRRGGFDATAAVRAGAWPRTALIGRELAGSTLGLLGFGAIGRAVARRALAFDMAVIGHDPALPADDPAWAAHGTRPVGFAALLAAADVLSLHVPLVPATRHLIDATALAALRPGAILINAARGGVVDEAALAAALRSNRLGGAVLDVFEREPLPAGAGFDDSPHLILTPHIAGLTEEANTRTGMMVADAVRRVLETGAKDAAP